MEHRVLIIHKGGFLVFLFFLLFACGPVHAEKEAVSVSKASGRAVVIREGHPHPATVGMPCRKKDTLKTGTDGRLDIVLNNLAGFRLLPSSEVILRETARDTMQVEIVQGNILINAKPLPKNTSFKLETPIAVAAVRGTQFWGRVDLTNLSPRTTLAVREGSIEITVRQTGNIFILEEGQALDVYSDATPPELRQAKREEIEALAQTSEILTSF
jgi:hypothetical protein